MTDDYYVTLNPNVNIKPIASPPTQPAVPSSNTVQRHREENMIDERFNRLLSPREVAAALSVDPKTVSRWAAAGRLRSIRTPGGHHRFFERDVLALLTPEGEHT